jgi:glutathione-independent formaldehyde dehydrogenase
VIGRDRVQIVKAVIATAIPLEDAPKGYAGFDAGAATHLLNLNDYIT